MSAKVESYCLKKGKRTITVDKGVKACINCIWYEQYYRQNRGNVKAWIPADTGCCLLHDCKRGPLVRPCKSFEMERKEIT